MTNRWQFVGKRVGAASLAINLHTDTLCIELTTKQRIHISTEKWSVKTHKPQQNQSLP